MVFLIIFLFFVTLQSDNQNLDFLVIFLDVVSFGNIICLIWLCFESVISI